MNTALSARPGSASRRLSSVVLPAPRKPVSTVTGRRGGRSVVIVDDGGFWLGRFGARGLGLGLFRALDGNGRRCRHGRAERGLRHRGRSGRRRADGAGVERARGARARLFGGRELSGLCGRAIAPEGGAAKAEAGIGAMLPGSVMLTPRVSVPLAPRVSIPLAPRGWGSPSASGGPAGTATARTKSVCPPRPTSTGSPVGV